MQEYEERFYDIHIDHVNDLYDMMKEWGECGLERFYLLDLMTRENFFDFCIKYSELYVQDYEDSDENDETEIFEDPEFNYEPELIVKKIEKPKPEIVPEEPSKPKWVILKRGSLPS